MSSNPFSHALILVHVFNEVQLHGASIGNPLLSLQVILPPRCELSLWSEDLPRQIETFL